MLEEPLAGWRIAREPYYAPQGDEVAAFEAAHALRLPLLLKGPTGCGKTRFVEHMAWRLQRPLVTIACNEDLSAADLVGRWLLDAEGGMRWQDGPLALAARHGAICYLDELVEARADTVVAVHPLADTRRVLPLERRNELLHAHPDFQLVASYNPGPGQRELKASTRQRFCALAFEHPAPAAEAAIVAHEGGVALELASRLVSLGERTRQLQPDGLAEGASTRLLVRAAQLVVHGLAPRAACRLAVAQALSDEPDLVLALEGAVDAVFAA